MRYLYIDNFRGFTNTYIPITDVNFLVGENTTGKTTTLLLLQLFGSPSFWYEQAFRFGPHYPFGAFKEMISQGSRKKRKFQIGYLSTEKNDNEAFAFLLTFSEHEGMPLTTHVDYYWRGKNVSVHIPITGETRVRITGRQLSNKVDNELKSIFKSWLSPSRSFKGFGTIEPNLGGKRYTLPLIMVITLKEAQSSGIPLLEKIQTTFADDAPFGPVRTRPKRLYHGPQVGFDPEGEHTPNLIRLVLESTKLADNFKRSLKRFGKTSGLFNQLSYKCADKKNPMSPFSISLSIKNLNLNLAHVGYGISQCLPYLVEIFSQSHKWFYIQQPEIHLHPKAQAAIGDILFTQANKMKSTFLVETHSDFIIDRFRLNYRKKKYKNRIESQVLFYQRNSKDNTVTPISITHQGMYSSDQPAKFRDFFLKEQLDLLGLDS
ncbi:MAG: AAA family ATPase [Sedimentisphaerales bacterium]|nr:AAA family ATPase [Sedimentisphaerales bacterium]